MGVFTIPRIVCILVTLVLYYGVMPESLRAKVPKFVVGGKIANTFAANIPQEPKKFRDERKRKIEEQEETGMYQPEPTWAELMVQKEPSPWVKDNEKHGNGIYSDDDPETQTKNKATKIFHGYDWGPINRTYILGIGTFAMIVITGIEGANTPFVLLVLAFALRELRVLQGRNQQIFLAN